MRVKVIITPKGVNVKITPKGVNEGEGDIKVSLFFSLRREKKKVKKYISNMIKIYKIFFSFLK